MVVEKTGFNRERFLANAHACCAGVWLAGMGLFPPMEGVAFAGLAGLTVIRWRPTLDAIRARSIRAPLVLVACFLAWMLAACAWGEGEGWRISHAPHRTFLGIFMVLGAGMPAWGVLCSISAPGLWWDLGILVSQSGLSSGRLFVPGSPCETFFGFTGLAACGIAGVLVGGSAWVRASGAAALLSALLGLSWMASRGSIVSVLVALLFCIVVRIVRGRDWLGAAVAATVVLIASMAIPFLPVWTKATQMLNGQAEAAVEDHPNRLIGLYRQADPARGFLHEWTVVRIPESPIFGHGAGSWRYDLRQGVPHVTQPPGRFEAWWERAAARCPHAHQVYLQTLYEYGIVGLVLLLAVGTSLLITCLRRRLDVPAVAAVALLVSSAVTGLADYPPNSRFLAFSLTAVLACASCRTRPA